MNSVFVSADIYPFWSKEGKRIERLALALSQKGKGEDVAVILPLYFAVSSGVRRRMRKVEEWTVEYGWRRIGAELFRLRQDGVSYYFIGCDRYFDRAASRGHFDDGERFAFFAHAALEVILGHLSEAELLVAAGWGASQVLTCLKWGEREWGISPACVLIPEEKTGQGCFSASVVSELLHLRPEARQGVCDGIYSYETSGLLAADQILCFSEAQVSELCARGDAALFRGKVRLLSPPCEPMSEAAFSASRIPEEKKRLKESLCEENGWRDREGLLVAVTGDLTESGAALLSRGLPDALAAGIRVVFCGMGAQEEVGRLLAATGLFADRFSFLLTPDPRVCRRVLLAVDALLLLSDGEVEKEREALSCGTLLLSPSGSERAQEGVRYGYEERTLPLALLRLLEDYKRRGSLRQAVRRAVRMAKESFEDPSEALLGGRDFVAKGENIYA